MLRATSPTRTAFRACHDITVFLELRRAAAACITEVQMWDISDPASPQFLWRYDNPGVLASFNEIFSEAAFSWDGSVVAVNEETGIDACAIPRIRRAGSGSSTRPPARSSVERGFDVLMVTDPAVAAARKLSTWNPQTQDRLIH